MYRSGDWVKLENEDGVTITGRLIHICQVGDKKYAMTELETGIIISYSFDELDKMVIYSW